MTMIKEKPRGFTVIELSIVLVIIGLVLGGILVGTDLIRAAEVRNIVQQVNSFNTAVYTFRNKFNCLPGDCAAAVSFGFDAPTAGNGDSSIGCGDISDMSACVDVTGPINSQQTREYVNFWYHLSAANLIAGNFVPYNAAATSQPAGHGITPETALKMARALVAPDDTPLTGGWAIRPKVIIGSLATERTNLAHNFVLGQHAVINTTDYSLYWPKDTFALDLKMDDGLPTSGIVKAYVLGNITLGAPFPLSYTVFEGSGGPNSNTCVNTDFTPPQYNVQLESGLLGLCGPAVKATF